MRDAGAWGLRVGLGGRLDIQGPKSAWCWQEISGKTPLGISKRKGVICGALSASVCEMCAWHCDSLSVVIAPSWNELSKTNAESARLPWYGFDLALSARIAFDTIGSAKEKHT